MVDIKKLKLKKKISVYEPSLSKDYIEGEIVGIDLWDLKVRVKIDDFNCYWYSGKQIKI